MKEWGVTHFINLSFIFINKTNQKIPVSYYKMLLFDDSSEDGRKS